MSFGNPYLLAEVPGVSAYLIGWGGFAVSQQAAARALLRQPPAPATMRAAAAAYSLRAMQDATLEVYDELRDDTAAR